MDILEPLLLNQIRPEIKKIISKFLETRELIIPSSDSLVHAENIPNTFIALKSEFRQQLMAVPRAGSATNNLQGRNDDEYTAPPVASANSKAKDTGMSKDMALLRQSWGVEWVIKILDAYSLLQRMATVLAWTLEINHFFLSMFGNTLAFSKLPLKDIVLFQ